MSTYLHDERKIFIVSFAKMLKKGRDMIAALGESYLEALVVLRRWYLDDVQ